MSDLQGDRIPGEEGRNRRRFGWLWLLGGLIVLLVIIGLIAHACASGGGGQGSAGGSQTNQTTGAQKAKPKGKAQPAKTSTSAKKGQAAASGSAGKSSTSGASAGGASAGGASAGGGAAGGSSGVSASVSGGIGGLGNVVTVPAASISGVNGWLAVRTDVNGRPGEVLGYAPLKPGENRNVRVSLKTPPAAGDLFVTVHKESPADGRFTFPNGDPTVTSAGQPVARTFAYAASGASPSGASTSGAAVAQSKPLPNTGGPSPLLAGGAFALTGAAALFLLRRRRFPAER